MLTTKILQFGDREANLGVAFIGGDWQEMYKLVCNTDLDSLTEAFLIEPRKFRESRNFLWNVMRIFICGSL